MLYKQVQCIMLQCPNGFVSQSPIFQSYTEDRKLSRIQIKSMFHYS